MKGQTPRPESGQHLIEMAQNYTENAVTRQNAYPHRELFAR
jgi:hypothetical protein